MLSHRADAERDGTFVTARGRWVVADERVLSDEAVPAVDMHDGSGDEAVAHDRDEGVGDIGWLTDPTNRKPLGHGRQPFRLAAPASVSQTGVSVQPGEITLTVSEPVPAPALGRAL